MEFFTAKTILTKADKGEVLNLQSALLGGGKNTKLDMFRRYYDGKQWDISTAYGAKGNTTTSGKLMFEERDQKKTAWQLRNGELKVWNVSQPVIDIYSSYTRGSVSDYNRIMIEDSESLTNEINDTIGNFDLIVSRITRRMAIDGVTDLKYVAGGGIEFIDSKEIFPVYWGSDRVGTIRIYKVDSNDPMVTDEIRDKYKNKNEDMYYLEAWLPTDLDNLKYEVFKFVDGVQVNVDQIVAPYPFDPYFTVVNKKNEYKNYDETNTEISDIANIIDIQDDINVYVTDLGLITRQVSMPMWKLMDSVYEKMIKGELNSKLIEESLQKLTIQAGRLLVAPLQKESGEGLPASSVDYLNQMFEQLSRITGIPRVVFNSDGLGNVAVETVQHLTESLRRRIDEKRTAIEQGVRHYIKLYLSEKSGEMVEMGKLLDNVYVQWAEIMGMNKNQQATLLIQAAQAQVLPKVYAIEELLDLFGDAERLNEVLGMENSNMLTEKIAYERQKLLSESKAEVEKVRKEATEDIQKREATKEEILKLISEA